MDTPLAPSTTFVSVTRLRLRSPWTLPAFYWYTGRSFRQVKNAPGHLASTPRRQPNFTFWTLTVWHDQAAMRAYRSSGAHRQAMPKLATWCDEASYTHWEQQGASLPTWEVAESQMKSEGHFSPVKHPSSAHAER
ncbi:MAG: hypothetical protein IGR76_18645 [Synechococcales cyanobacterium T60_A2020_003]|nr:hypothetical protein [Synechococcales cyanobacterium T60_A2020_003]